MAILENETKVSVIIDYVPHTGTVVSSTLYGVQGLKYTINLDTPIPYGWNQELRTEFVIEEKFVKGI